MPNVLLTRQLLGRLTAEHMVAAMEGHAPKATLEAIFDTANRMGVGIGESLLLFDENDPQAKLTEPEKH